MTLPKIIRPQMFVRTMVKGMLFELANRNAEADSADVPLWLIEGLSAHLQTFNMPTFIIQPKLGNSGDQIGMTGLDSVRRDLHGHAALSFQELSWPDPARRSKADQALYNDCAQLFFDELLRLKDGPACLSQMLDELPRHRNWQVAFLKGFHSHFTQLLDVEKWWGVTCVTFTSTDLKHPWTREECWQKLQQILDIPVEVRLSPEQMPSDAEITLQEVITQWQPNEALPALRKSVHELEDLRQRVVPELRPLVEAYNSALHEYLHDSGSDHPGWSTRNEDVRLAGLKEPPPHKLDALDARRETLRPKFVALPHPTEFGVTDSSGGNVGKNP